VKRHLHELGTKTGGAVESLNKTDTPIASVSQNTMDQLTRLYKMYVFYWQCRSNAHSLSAMEDTSDLNRRTARGGLDRSLRIAAGKGSPDDLMRRVVGEAVREDDLPTEIWRLAREAASDDASDDLIRRIATAAAINSAPRSLARRLVTQGQAMLPPTITDGGSRQRGQSILLPKASFEDS